MAETQKSPRETRLAEALRANLKRRKVAKRGQNASAGKPEKAAEAATEKKKKDTPPHG